MFKQYILCHFLSILRCLFAFCLHVLPVYARLTVCPKGQRGSAQEEFIPGPNPFRPAAWLAYLQYKRLKPQKLLGVLSLSLTKLPLLELTQIAFHCLHLSVKIALFWST